MDITSASWRKSSYSGGASGNCVEVADANRIVAVRDSRDLQGPVLAFRPGSLNHWPRRPQVA